MLFSGDETTDVGRDTATPWDDYESRGSEFTGKVRWVQLDIDDAAETVDHVISPEQRLQIALGQHRHGRSLFRALDGAATQVRVPEVARGDWRRKRSGAAQDGVFRIGSDDRGRYPEDGE